MRVHTNLAVLPLRRGWCLQKFDIWSQSLGEITWIYSMSYIIWVMSVFPSHPWYVHSAYNILQWLASLCIACWWSQQHSMVHRQQIKSPLPWNPCCKCNPCSQLARKVPGTCSVGRCTTFLTLLVPLHFTFDYGFLQTRQFESRKGELVWIRMN